MKIGELSTQSSLSRDTLRYYEDIGLIQPVRMENNYRDYPPKTLEVLQFIQIGKELGLTLAEIRGLVTPIFYDDLTFGESAGLIEGHIGAIDQKIRDLTVIRNRLEHIVNNCPTYGRIKDHLPNQLETA
jgi:MerR family copper efflux transcriptional regulator